MLSRFDKIIIFILIILSLILFLCFGLSSINSSGRILKIQSEGEIYAEYKLDSQVAEKELQVKNKNGNCTIFISKNEVYVKNADCKDELCIGKKISKVGQTIVCLPNKILIYIVSEKDTKIDSVAYWWEKTDTAQKIMFWWLWW